MSNPTRTDGGNGNGEGVARAQVPHLTVSLDPRTGRIEIGGSVPTWEYGKMLFQAAADECERKIMERRANRLVEIATADQLPGIKG